MPGLQRNDVAEYKTFSTVNSSAFAPVRASAPGPGQDSNMQAIYRQGEP